jgi:hypothetical protein
MFRLTVLALLLVLALAGSARAMPGDPPVEPLTPADGAEVPANPAGIPVSFRCPDYRIAMYGSLPDIGHYDDYAVRFSDGPALGADGRLAHTPYGNDAGPSPAPDGTCTAKLDTFDTASSPEITGGRVYWQAYRYCNGCTPQYETGAVRSFVVRPSVTGTLRAPARVYGGYPALFTLVSAAGLSGAEVVLQRRAGARWLTVVRRPFQTDRTLLVATLPAGRTRLRALAVTSTSQFALGERTLTVRRPGRRSTSHADDGRYRAHDVAFRVTGGGTRLRAFRATLSVFCVGPTIGDNQTRIAVAELAGARIAPDGSVTAELRTQSGASTRLTGRLEHHRFAGSVAMAFSTCAGTRTLTARR